MRLDEISVPKLLSEMAHTKRREAAISAGNLLADDFIAWAKDVWEHNPLAKKKHKDFKAFVSSIHDWRRDWIQEFEGVLEKTFDVAIRNVK